MHPVDAVPFSNLNGCTHLGELVIKLVQVKAGPRLEIDDDFEILAWFDRIQSVFQLHR